MVATAYAITLPAGGPSSRCGNAAAASPRHILIFIAACTIAKLFSAWAVGFAGDEAYTVVISRTLALSYFDHPPLHQWIVHACAALTGEGWWLKLPFLIMAIGINIPLYGLTLTLFGRDAALWALFGFNAAAYFVVWPDGLILPDVPLFLFMTCAIWAVAEILFGQKRTQARLYSLWLAAGFAFGLAGLAKYSAAFAPMSLFGFLLFSPRNRHWLWRPHPYAGAALGLLIFSPALIWNYQHDWISFAFQSGRLSGGAALNITNISRLAQVAGTQAASLSPWVGGPLVLALAAALRSRDSDSPSRLLLWLVGVPLLLFALVPFFGSAPIPHWFNSAWIFAYPLLGYWLVNKSAGWHRRWSAISAAISALCFAGFVIYATGGPLIQLVQPAHATARHLNAVEWSYGWPELKQPGGCAVLDSEPRMFAAVTSWRVGGRVGEALGPGVPVCVFSEDPRGFAFACDMNALIGKDALIVIPKEEAQSALPGIAQYFERLGPRTDCPGWRKRRVVTLVRGYKLLRSYRAPYGVNSN
jgi:hypothetical membrane protein